MRLTDIQVDPRPVAVVRIALGVVTVLNAVESAGLLHEIARGKLRLPVHDLLPAPTVPAVSAFLVAAVVAGVAIGIGWRTAGAALLATGLNIWVLMWDQQTYSSHRLLMTLLVAYLIFARADAAWSVSRRGGTAPWWPQLLMMTQLSVCYFFAAVTKVNVLFLSGVPLSLWVWVPLPWWIFTLMAVATVAVELYLAIGLWSPVMRRRAAVVGVLLHTSIVMMMRDETVPLLAFAVTCLSLYWLFLSRPDMGVDEGNSPESVGSQDAQPPEVRASP